jgi:hypothetical protein
VPLPWKVEGTSFGFGDGGSHLPQPDWFSKYAVEAQDGTEGSTLELYRTALKLRRELQTSEDLEWVENGNPDVLHFRRQRLAVRDQLREHCSGPSGRQGTGQQRPARGRQAARQHHRMAALMRGCGEGAAR